MMFIQQSMIVHFNKFNGDFNLGYLWGIPRLPGPVCQPHHQEGFPEKGFAAKAEEGMVHKGTNEHHVGLESVHVSDVF